MFENRGDRDVRLRAASDSALMAAYLEYVDAHHSDSGFTSVVGSALQALRHDALQRALVTQQTVGLELSDSGRELLAALPNSARMRRTSERREPR